MAAASNDFNVMTTDQGGGLFPPGWDLGGNIMIGPDGEITGTISGNAGTSVPTSQQTCGVFGCGRQQGVAMLILLITVAVLILRR